MARFREWRTGAHPFFWVVALMLVASVAAAAAAPSRSPAYALQSAWLYRIEVGGASFLALTVAALVLWLSYSGRSLGHVQVPGVGVELRNPDPDLDDAADELAGYRQWIERRLEKLERTVERITVESESDP
jgi:hypothetical protein